MSTRAVIARPISDVGWKGNYHHSDGYPSGLGQTLWNAYHGHFNRDVHAMLETLIDAHPGGLSFIVNTDLSKPFGYREFEHCPSISEDSDGYLEFFSYPRCFCHGDRSENRDGSEDWYRESINNVIGEHWDIEWVYVCHPMGMDILTSHGANGHFRHVAFVLWSDPEPDWQAIRNSVR